MKRKLNINSIKDFGKPPVDKEIQGLCCYVNSLPGITTMGSCSGHGKDKSWIVFGAEPDCVGLYFLVRSICNRYFEYGNNWRVTLEINDMNTTPFYILESTKVFKKDAESQCKHLMKNLDYHLNYKEFLGWFNINTKEFDYIEE